MVDEDKKKRRARSRTTRRQKKHELKDSEAAYQFLFESNPLPMWVCDSETLAFLAVNEAAIRHYGYSREEFLQMTIRDIQPPEDSSDFLVASQKRREKMVEHGIWKHKKKDGTIIIVEIAIGDLSFAARPCLLVLANDVTERKRMEEALRESEDRYRDLVEHSFDLICTHDLNGMILSVNRETVKLMGYDPKDFIGKKSIRDILSPEFRDQFDDYLQRIRRYGTASGIMVVRTGSGEKRIWEYRNSLRTEGVAEPIVRGMAHDITERWRAEEALRESQARLAGILESAMDAIITIDDEKRIVMFNAAAEKMFRCSAAEAMGQPIDRFIPGQLPVSGRERAPVFSETETSSRSLGSLSPINGIRAGVEAFPIEASISHVQTGKQHLYTVILRDITERRRAEMERDQLIAQLQDALARIKTLTGLLPICANCKMIRDDEGNWTQLEVYIETHSEAEFSHGICPKCARELYPDYFEDGDTLD